ncbi:MAG: rhodanese-like domain-containing protein [Aquabacterium sp.]|nr:rhodanese-like domain-containing protein [Aquabacterium sp.]
MHPLISAQALADRLATPAGPPLRLFDVTAHLRPATPGPWVVESGRADYLAAHIPGAAFIDLQADLSDGASPLRFTQPGPARLAAAFAAAGLGDGDDCVVYSSAGPMWATRVWWLLQSIGVAARVLDGGLPVWRAEGRPVAGGAGGASADAPAATLTPRPQPKRWADKQDMLLAIGNQRVCTLNALSAALHVGTADIHYGRPGHILGSVNLPYTALLDAQGCFLPADKLRAALDSVGALAAARVLCYCGGGIAATLDAMALTLAGHTNVAVYDGSLQEWAGDPALPMATAA